MSEDEENYRPKDNKKKDKAKIIFRLVLIGVAGYLIYSFILYPLGFMLAWDEKIMIAAVVLVSVTAGIMVIVLSNKAGPEPDFSLGMEEAKREIKRDAADVTRSIDRLFDEMEYHIKMRNEGVARQIYIDITEMAKDAIPSRREEIMARCSQAKSKIDELKKNLEKG